MSELRRFNRLVSGDAQKATVIYAGSKEDAQLMDISAGGMKVCLSKPVSIGDSVSAKVKIHDAISDFFVAGKINRIFQRDGIWEAAVAFEKVSAVPFLNMYMYQLA